jgi:hypothetical protein
MLISSHWFIGGELGGSARMISLVANAEGKVSGPACASGVRSGWNASA